MERMWSPWRARYIASFKKPARKRKPGESLFTDALKAHDDETHLIVWRGPLCFVIMNKYPYNSGHLLIVPNRPVGAIGDLTADELAEIMHTTQRAVDALDRVMQPQGYNFGANLGRASGAGVENHVHFHIVPRWNGDTNFMPVLTGTKVISEDMVKTMKKLRKAFREAARPVKPRVRRTV